MKTAKERKLRVGDEIRIENPEFFVRCGYPLDLAAALRRVEQEWDHLITAFLKDLGFTDHLLDHRLPRSCQSGYAAAHSQIKKSLAYGLLLKERFGGSQRTIHTEQAPELKGRICYVSAVKFVKTGTYESGYWSSGAGTDWCDEYDPPCLSNQRTHRILQTTLPKDFLDSYWIEDCHVSRVESTQQIV